MRLPSPRTRRLVFAVILVLTPFWGPTLHLTGPDYTYESAEIAVEDNRLVVPDDDSRTDLHHGLDGFACSFGSSVTRYCTLEATTLNERVEVDHPDVTGSTSGYLGTPEPYLAYFDGRVFAYNSTWEDGNYVLWTERVSATDALADEAYPADRYPPVETAIQKGAVTTNEKLWADQHEARVFEVDGEYFVVFVTGQESQMSSNAQFEEILTWFAVVYGAALLFGRD